MFRNNRSALLLCLIGALASPACFTSGGGMMMPPPLAVTNTAPPATLAGQAFAFNIQVTGGAAPYMLTETTMLFPGGMGANGTPCQGLMINFTTGAVTGTPVNSGTCGPVNFSVTDSSTPALAFQFSLSFRVVGVLAITTATLPHGTEGVAYNQTVATSGGATPLAFSISAGALPAGLMLNPTTGAITGTPTMGGTFNFTVRAADSLSPAQAVTQAYTVRILQITTMALPDGLVGQVYNQALAVTGEIAPVLWALAAGSGPVPPGLMLNANGTLTGMPTTPGTFNFTVLATDSDNPARTDTQPLSLRIIAPLVINTATLPNGVEGVAFNQAVMTTGGLAPVTFAVTAGALPPGTMLNPATGAITGTPAIGGTFNFTLTATDSFNPAQSDSQAYTVLILQITTAALPNGTVNVAYNQPLAVTGEVAPVNWTLAPGSGPLPPGLMLDAVTGIISGTPTQAGTFNFTVQATDSDTPPRTHTRALSIQIAAAPAPLSITTLTIPNGVFNTAYNQTIMTNGGVGPLMFAITLGSLPAGMSLDPNTGVISGNPTVGGTFNITVEVTDSSMPAQTASQAYTLLILQITTQSLPDGIEGQPYSQNLLVGGAVAPVVWTVAAGSAPLPPGLTLNAMGTLSGTPTQQGLFNFLVQVTDADTPPRSDVQPLSLRINPPPAGIVTDIHVSRSGGPFPIAQVFSFRHDTATNSFVALSPLPISYQGTQPGPITGDNSLIAIGEFDNLDLDFTDGFVTFFTGDGLGNFMQSGGSLVLGSAIRALAFDPTKTVLFVSYSKPAMFGGFEEHLAIINVSTRAVLTDVLITGTIINRLLPNPDPNRAFLYTLGQNGIDTDPMNANGLNDLNSWAYSVLGILTPVTAIDIPFPNDMGIKETGCSPPDTCQVLAVSDNRGFQYVFDLVDGILGGSGFVGPIGGGGLFGEALVSDPLTGDVCKYTVDGGGNLRIFRVEDLSLAITQSASSPLPPLPGGFFFTVDAHPVAPIIYVYGVDMIDPDGPGPIPGMPFPTINIFNVDTATCDLSSPIPNGLFQLVPGPPGPNMGSLVVPQ